MTGHSIPVATARDPWPAFAGAIHIEQRALAKPSNVTGVGQDRNAFVVLANLAAGGTGGDGKGGRTDWHGLAAATRRRRDTLRDLALNTDGPGNNPAFVAHYRTIRALVHKVESLANINDQMRSKQEQEQIA